MTPCKLCGVDLDLHIGPLGACPGDQVKVPARHHLHPCPDCQSSGNQVLDEPSVVQGRGKAVINCPSCSGSGWRAPDEPTNEAPARLGRRRRR